MPNQIAHIHQAWLLTQCFFANLIRHENVACYNFLDNLGVYILTHVGVYILGVYTFMHVTSSWPRLVCTSYTRGVYTRGVYILHEGYYILMHVTSSWPPLVRTSHTRGAGQAEEASQLQKDTHTRNIVAMSGRRGW